MLKAKLANNPAKLRAAVQKFSDIEMELLDSEVYVAKPAVHLPVSTKTIPVVSAPRTLSENFVLDSEQQAFVDHVAAGGESAALSGFAGTGKTQATVEAVLAAITISPPCWSASRSTYTSLGIDPDHPYIPANAPGVAVCALTRNATANLMSRLPKVFRYVYTDSYGHSVDLGDCYPQSLCMTLHKLLQFQPVSSDFGSESTSMFAPARNENNKLPPELRAIFIDEATLPNLTLLRQLLDACHEHTRIYFIGDIFQIQAVGGISTLAAVMTFARVFTLQKIYRYMGAILRQATDIRLQETKYLPPKSNDKAGDLETGRTTRITYGSDRVSDEAAYKYCGEFLAKAFIKGVYVPGLDMAISFHDPDLGTVPNKFGITNIYRHYQSIVDKELGRATYYVRTAGQDKHGNAAVVVAAGDTVYADVAGERTLWLVLRVVKNQACKSTSSDQFPPAYIGTRCPRRWKEVYTSAVDPSSKLDWAMVEASGLDTLAFDEMDSGGDSYDLPEDKVGRQASHLLTLIDVGSMFTYVQPRTATADDANKLCELAIKQLTFMALNNDQMQVTNGVFITDDAFTSTVRDTLSAFGIGEYADSSLKRIGNGATIKDVKPNITTAHASQGLGGRMVVFMSHHTTPGFTEMAYTACTRARSHLVTITHPAFWGTSATKELSKHRSDCWSPQIPGVTTEDKIASLLDAIKSGSISFGASERRDLMNRLGYGS